MVNLDLYRVFYTVAKCGSLTKAAEELYISQPAVSQSVKQLENQLGVVLFHRTHRGMELTEQGGKLIMGEVESALRLLQIAENRIGEMKASATGTLRIGASDTIFEYFLADKIVEYHERFPAVKIELFADVTLDTVEKLKAKRLDVAFVNLPIDVDEELKLEESSVRLHDRCFVGEKFRALAENALPVRLARLKEYPLICTNDRTVARRSLDSFFASVGVELTPSIEVGSWDLMKRLVERGMGVGVMPKEYAQKELAEGRLLEVEIDPPLPVRSIGMLLLKEQPVSYALHCFIGYFRNFAV